MMSETGNGISGEMAEAYGMTKEKFISMFRAVAMPGKYTDAEFAQCCVVAHSHNLNPLTKEIYFMRTQAGQVQPIVSVDGWIKKMNSHPEYEGIEFEDTFDEKGELFSITARVHRSDRRVPTAVTEFMKECKGTSSAWKKTPARMLRHRALMQAARIAFGFAGIMDRDEFDQWQNGERKSAYVAKQDGTSERFAELQTLIADAASDEDLQKLWEDSAAERVSMPAGWASMLGDAFADRHEALSVPAIDIEVPQVEPEQKDLIDVAKLLDGFDQQMAGCGDLDSLNEVWIEIEGHELDGSDGRVAEQMYERHELRINAA